MFEWNNSYLTGIGSIDAQHQTLFQIGGKLHEAMVLGKGKALLSSILERLVQYTESHFAHEERLLRQHNYPDFTSHKAQHDALTRQVRQFQAKFESGEAAITVELMHFLKNWLANHIKGNDLKYVDCLRGKPIAATLR